MANCRVSGAERLKPAWQKGVMPRGLSRGHSRSLLRLTMIALCFTLEAPAFMRGSFTVDLQTSLAIGADALAFTRGSLTFHLHQTAVYAGPVMARERLHRARPSEFYVTGQVSASCRRSTYSSHAVGATTSPMPISESRLNACSQRNTS